MGLSWCIAVAAQPADRNATQDLEKVSDIINMNLEARFASRALPLS